MGFFITSVCCVVAIEKIQINLFFMKLLKCQYLIAISFVCGHNLFDWAMTETNLIFSNNLQNTSGSGIWISKINETFSTVP